MMRIGITKKINVFECQPHFSSINHYSDIKYGKYYLKKIHTRKLKKIDKKKLINLIFKD